MKTVKRVYKIANSYRDVKMHMMSSYKWHETKDIRITMLSRCVNAFDVVAMVMAIDKTVLDKKDGWKTFSKFPISNREMKMMRWILLTNTKINCVNSLFFAIESGMRLLVRTLDSKACSSGSAEFKSIYSFLLKKLKLKKYETLLDLFRLTRNTLHNNGMHLPTSGKNTLISYKGKSYVFEVWKLIDFVTWKFLFDLSEDIREMIREILENNEIVQFAIIPDPLH